jgi:SnoaL-like domain
MHTDQKHTILLDPVVSRWIEAFNAHNVATLVDLYTGDAELFDSGMNRPRRGRKEIGDWFTWRFRSTPTINYRPVEQARLDEGRVVVRWIAGGRGPRLFGLSWLARPFHIDGESRFTLCDGLICEQRGTYDHLSVLRQIVPPLQWLPAWVASFIYTLYLWRNHLV